MSNVLGVSRETGTYLLLDTVTQAGWSIAFVAGGRGIVATARRGDLVVEVDAETVADAALPLAELVSRRNRQVSGGPR